MTPGTQYVQTAVKGIPVLQRTAYSVQPHLYTIRRGRDIPIRRGYGWAYASTTTNILALLLKASTLYTSIHPETTET